MPVDNLKILKERMGVASDDELTAFNDAVVDEFRTNHGQCGGRFEGNPMIIITMTGAKSGRQVTKPLTYCADGDDCIIMASAGGSPQNPAWFFNLEANPEISVERGEETYSALAVLTKGAERQDAFDKMAAALPRFGDYQAGVEREIPMFRLVRSS
jgi:deazaflavin-dependent oxidoreductase (nitroreductase family)